MRMFQRLLIGVAFLGLVSGSLYAQLASQSSGAASTPASAPVKVRPTRPETYGTAHVTYVQIPATAFRPWDSSQSFTSSNFGRGQRWGNTGGLDFNAPINLPAGAQIVYLELDGNDTSTTAFLLGSLTVCSFDATACTYYPTTGVSVGGDCNIAGFICSGLAAAPGSGLMESVNLASENIVVDNYYQSYSLLAETSGAFDGSIAIGGMIVGYVLQVSPAPATQTFLDVAPADFGYQYIEALAASGITGGCGGGNFCPNGTLTRAQMAIFLAKALGLQW
jgi:S-layer homology domain